MGAVAQMRHGVAQVNAPHSGKCAAGLPAAARAFLLPHFLMFLIPHYFSGTYPPPFFYRRRQPLAGLWCGRRRGNDILPRFCIYDRCIAPMFFLVYNCLKTKGEEAVKRLKLKV